MLYYFAPMEGLTGPVFRRVHHEFFPGVDRYYTPFLSPTQNHVFTARDLREILPGEGDGVPTVPQLLGKTAADLLWAMEELAAMGYGEVNLNLGCPSSTVTAQGKGSALLGDPGALAALLEELYAAAPLPLSLKTRLGLREAGEFAGLLEVYNRFPAAELIVHARTRAEQYKGPVHPEVFAWAAAHTALPLCYNGDVRTAEDCRRLEEALPGLHAVMIGRGLVANPTLVREARGGEKLAMDELRSFHDALFAAYRQRYGANNAMHRMKEVWACLRENFPEGGHITGKIARAKDPETLLYWAGRAFAELKLPG